MPHKSVIQAMMVAHMHSGTVADHGTMRRVLRAALEQSGLNSMGELEMLHGMGPMYAKIYRACGDLLEAAYGGDDTEHT